MPMITRRGTAGRFSYIKRSGEEGGRQKDERDRGREIEVVYGLSHFTFNRPVFVGQVCQRHL